VSLQVVEAATQFTPDLSEGVVVIESDEVHDFSLAIEELQGSGAKQLAVAYASQKGLAPAACKPHGPGAYPINAKGMSLEQVTGEDGKPLPQQHPEMQPARYRTDVPVARRLV